ncbi:hypothetical protein QVD17_30386 [Tagetes erecta]|uniref:Uncharacterized protein n=1 Tax=Tagetes erecta TaxID=13708 RepID=A0AAD8K1T2_TARER|nr:hypothetical protein QVD17_30386 [Tagetes erecta]
MDFVPIPFCFFNSWLDRYDYDSIIKQACSSFTFAGPPDLYLIEKLRHIKSVSKLWINDIKVKEENTFNSRSLDIQNLDIILETRELLEEEQWTYKECKAGLRELKDHKNKDVRQRSRA